MSRKGNEGKKIRLFAPETAVVPDITNGGKQKIKSEKGEGIQAQIPRYCDSERCLGYHLRLNDNANPGNQRKEW